MEGVGRIVAERAGVRESDDDVVVLEVGARPAVGEHERERRRSHARLMHEVQSEVARTRAR